VHGRIRIGSDERQLQVRCFPDPFSPLALQLQPLLGDGHGQGGPETPEGRSAWDLGPRNADGFSREKPLEMARTIPGRNWEMLIAGKAMDGQSFST